MRIFKRSSSFSDRSLLTVLLALSLAVLLTACAAPAPDGSVPSPAEDASPAAATPADNTKAGEPPEQAAVPSRRVAPPMSSPLPPSRTAEATSGQSRKIARPGAGSGSGTMVDLQCGSDNDCEIKNVGSCCGERPACVNKDSPVNPESVAAECKQSGMVSTCGFPAISACQCVKGQCQGSDAGMIQ